jgi:tRNA-splicing ligase RtcB
MFELTGKYSTAKIFTDNVENTAQSQIINLLNQPFVEGSKVRIMSDVHAGAGCVIGFTADLGDKVIPNLVGVDIGCGMLVVELGKIDIDLAEFDAVVHKYVPSGHNIHDLAHVHHYNPQDYYCANDLLKPYVFDRSVGTLGGGNHFIELDKDDDGMIYLVVHSGSRNLGKQVADIYQKKAISHWKNGGVDYKQERLKIIDGLRSIKKGYEIPETLALYDKQYKNAKPLYPPELCFLTGELRGQYLADMKQCQVYASINRNTMANIILNRLFNGAVLAFYEHFETVHNYINFKDNIIRKGAVSAYKNEKLIVPINMRDGSLLCTGKGNADWNNSAPHGAGRLMGRNEAKRTLSMTEFTETMKGVYSTTVSNSTLDEAPSAYKPMAEIIANIQDTVSVDKIIKPIYNFKNAEE